MKKISVSYGFTLSFLAACALLQIAWVPLWPAILLVLVSGGAALLFKKETMGWTLIAVATGLLLATLRIGLLHMPHDAAFIGNLPENEVREVKGWVTASPDRRPLFTRYVVSVDAVWQGDAPSPAHGTVLVTDRTGWPQYDYGDHLSVSGKFEIPKAVDDFDYAAYLRSQGIDRTTSYAKIVKLDAGTMPLTIRFSPLRFLTPLRERFEATIRRTLPEPHASLLAGLLTGSRTGLSPALTENFRRSGLTHIVAISGSNITMLLAVFSSLLFWLPLKKRFFPLTVGIVLFMMFVGAGAPVVRASIMGLLGLVAIQAERTTMPRLLILWTAMLMLLWNPLQILYDPGFQLSFLATLGIGELGPWLKRVLSFVPETLGIRESLATTIAAEIATLPVSVLLFHQFSLVAPLANLLIAPLIPLSMLTGFIATALFPLSPTLGLGVGYLAWFVLELMVKIVTVLGSLPYASLSF